MDTKQLISLSRDIAGQFEEVDRWVFAQSANDREDLLSMRANKIAPIIEATLELIEQAKQYNLSQPEGPDALRTLQIIDRLESATKVERCITAFLHDPSHDQNIIDLNLETQTKQHYSSSTRTYRYIVWQRQNFSSAKTSGENGVSAVLRVKNEVDNLRIIVPVLLFYFDEIVVVDHQSTDKTWEYVEGLQNSKIRLVSYKTETAKAGDFYDFERQNGKGSLADYYNFAFEQATMDYVCKWDADMYPLPPLGPTLTAMKTKRLDVVVINGCDCFGLPTCNEEPRIYKRALNFRYDDIEYYENLLWSGADISVGKTERPVYLHIKKDALLQTKNPSIPS